MSSVHTFKKNCKQRRQWRFVSTESSMAINVSAVGVPSSSTNVRAVTWIDGFEHDHMSTVNKGNSDAIKHIVIKKMKPDSIFKACGCEEKTELIYFQLYLCVMNNVSYTILEWLSCSLKNHHHFWMLIWCVWVLLLFYQEIDYTGTESGHFLKWASSIIAELNWLCIELSILRL